MNENKRKHKAPLRRSADQVCRGKPEQVKRLGNHDSGEILLNVSFQLD